MATRKNKSDVWKTFTKSSGTIAKCNLCEKEIPTVGGNTSGMLTHMRNTHPDTMTTDTPQRKLNAFGIRPQRPCADMRQEAISNLIAKMLTDEMLPMSLVESASFRALLAYMEPNYKLPCRQTMTARMTAKKEGLKKRVKDDMDKNGDHVSVTTDIWTSLTNEAYMSFTATYITQEWAIRNVVLDSVLMQGVIT